MNIEPWLPLLSVTAAPSGPVSATALERAAFDAAAHAHAEASDAAAAAAAGVEGANGDDNSTDEQHADGRSPWELPARQSSDATIRKKASDDPRAGAPSDSAVGRSLDLLA